MKMLSHCAKLRLHNCNYFSSFSQVFAKADTFFYGVLERGLKYILKSLFLNTQTL
jgi:hypothetical protein